MRSSSLPRSAFTLIEMVVVLAILGIALSIAGPALMRPVAADNLQSTIDRTRNLALRRAEPVTLTIERDGKWVARSPRSGTEPVATGQLGERSVAPMRIDISAVGLCTSDDLAAEGAGVPVMLNPFACTVGPMSVPAR